MRADGLASSAYGYRSILLDDSFSQRSLTWMVRQVTVTAGHGVGGQNGVFTPATEPAPCVASESAPTLRPLQSRKLRLTRTQHAFLGGNSALRVPLLALEGTPARFSPQLAQPACGPQWFVWSLEARAPFCILRLPTVSTYLHR